MSRPYARVVVLVGAALALAPAYGVAQPAAPTLTILAASSLSDVFPRIDAAPRFTFAASDALAAQIRLGAPADVFAAASPAAPQALLADGLVERPVTFATNRLVIAVPAGNPAHIGSVYDLRRPGVRVLIGQRGVPIGDYARQVLRKVGLERAVLANVVSQERDARALLGKIALGVADAAFVYATDVRAADGKAVAVALPTRAQPVVRYQAAVVAASRDRPAARAFLRRLLSPAGRRALRLAGFGLPPRARTAS